MSSRHCKLLSTRWELPLLIFNFLCNIGPRTHYLFTELSFWYAYCRIFFSPMCIAPQTRQLYATLRVITPAHSLAKSGVVSHDVSCPKTGSAIGGSWGCYRKISFFMGPAKVIEKYWYARFGLGRRAGVLLLSVPRHYHYCRTMSCGLRIGFA
jgi:hypothetical protein